MHVLVGRSLQNSASFGTMKLCMQVIWYKQFSKCFVILQGVQPKESLTAALRPSRAQCCRPVVQMQGYVLVMLFVLESFSATVVKSPEVSRQCKY